MLISHNGQQQQQQQPKGLTCKVSKILDGKERRERKKIIKNIYRVLEPRIACDRGGEREKN
jgi:hypothetical protein